MALLIHKETMGVLDYVWTGSYRHTPSGEKIPVRRRATLEYLRKQFPELDPAEWWELPEDHPLTTLILRNYPWLTPVVGPDGELLDVKNSRREETKRQEQEVKQRRQKEAQSRGYRQAGRMRQLGLFSFLNTNKEE